MPLYEDGPIPPGALGTMHELADGDYVIVTGGRWKCYLGRSGIVTGQKSEFVHGNVLVRLDKHAFISFPPSALMKTGLRLTQKRRHHG